MAARSTDGIVPIGNRSIIDIVKKQLITYMVCNVGKAGHVIPKEKEMAEALGVSLTVVRKALAPLKLLGIISYKSKAGTQLADPALLGALERLLRENRKSGNQIMDAISLRQALEIGIADKLFKKVTTHDFARLCEHLTSPNSLINLLNFHDQLIKIVSLNIYKDFESILNPVHGISSEFGEKIATDQVVDFELLQAIRVGDKQVYAAAIRRCYSYIIEILVQEKLI